MRKKRLKLVVFARSPVLGCVKKRIARSLGQPTALAVYRKLFRQTIRATVAARAADPSIDLILNHLGDRPDRDLPSGFDGVSTPQSPQGMSENLAAVVSASSLEGCRGVMVIGTDHPTLEPGHVIEMDRLLSHYQVAIGPTEDGGFWSLATAVPLYDTVKRLPLGTNEALKCLLDSLADQDISFGLGPVLWDVDTPQDLARWKNLLSRQIQ